MSQLRCLQDSDADSSPVTTGVERGEREAGGSNGSFSGTGVHICDAVQDEGEEERLVMQFEVLVKVVMMIINMQPLLSYIFV